MIQGGDFLKRESRGLEYKENFSNTFLKTVSAYANYGTGKIVFGVNDSMKLIGLEGELSSLCLNLENKINDNLKPVPDYTISVDDKNRTIELEIFKGEDTPYLYKGKAYKRADFSTLEVDRTEYNRLILEGNNQDYEELSSKNRNLSFRYLEEKLKKELNIQVLDKNILKTLNLFSDFKGYNIAGELLSEENKFSGIDVVKFGDSIDEFVQRDVFEEMSVIQQYDMAVDIYRKNYQYELIEGTGRKRVERIPEKAFREALANSMVHRCWDIRANITLSMYQDRIEISSPGGLPFGISKEEYLYGQISILRNPILANVFFRLGYIEKFGTGIRRINQIYKDSIIKPDYKMFEHSIVVVLPVFNTNRNVLKGDERIVFELFLREKELLRSEIEDKLGIKKAKSIRILNVLLDKNVIEKIGTGRGTKYRLL